MFNGPLSVLSSISVCEDLFAHTSLFCNTVHSTPFLAKQELTAFRRLLEGVVGQFSIFYDSLRQACADFQGGPKPPSADAKMTQYFQLALGSLLKFGEGFHQQFSELKLIIAALEGLSKSFSLSVEQTLGGLQAQNAQLEKKTRVFVKDFQGLVRAGRKETDAESLPPAHLHEQSYTLHEGMLGQFGETRRGVQASLLTLSYCEGEVKEQLRSLLLSAVQTLFSGKTSEVAVKVASIEENFDCFALDSQRFNREFSLEFCPAVLGQELRYVNEAHYKRLEAVLSNNYSRQLRERVLALKSEVHPRHRVFVELFLHKLYRSSGELGRETFEALNRVIADGQTLEFFVLSMILKKQVLLLEKAGTPVVVRREQFRNFQQISHIVLIQDMQDHPGAGEHIYHYLRFCFAVFGEERESLIELMSRVPLLHDNKFWLKVFEYLQGAFARVATESDTGPQSSLKLYGRVRSLLGAQARAAGRNAHKNKAFEEISVLLFKTKIDVETTADILLHVAKAAGLDLAFVKSLMQKNEEYFFYQIVEGCRLLPGVRLTRSPHPRARTARLLCVVKNALRFFDDTEIIDQLSGLSHEFYRHRPRLISAMLYRARLDDPARRRLIAYRLRPLAPNAQLRLSFKLEETDSIISLDVRRTSIFGKEYDAAALENILHNVSHASAGNFPYYQGLNYIVNYLCTLYGARSELVYNLALRLMRDCFLEYVEKDLKGLNKLFFYLKRLVKAHLPRLALYLECDLKLNVDLVLASWCLTLFTTTTQYHPRSAFLDDAFDVFLGKGWAGFLQVVLVIFEELQEKLLTLSYEEIVAMLSDLPRTNFSEVVDAPRYTAEGAVPFNLKNRVRRYRSVNQKQLAVMCQEYEFTKMQFKEFWVKVLFKLC